MQKAFNHRYLYLINTKPLLKYAMYAPDHPRKKEARDVMYRSNSSLDLIYGDHPSGNGLRREYGSHGSIDVIGGANERGPAMVHKYNVPTADRPSSLCRVPDRLSGIISGDHADGPSLKANSSPKPRSKLNKLWATTAQASRNLEDSTLSTPNFSESAKRRQFAHYDCQSLMANLSYAAELRGALLSRRRNTTTGASAASLLATKGIPPGEDTTPDTGDGRSNEVIESCPFFRNELGGEEERCISLCARTARGPLPGLTGSWHRPRTSYGISVLEYQPGSGTTHWRHGCPFARTSASLPIESQDQGALYYRNYFYNQPHQNWFGMDEALGPVAISIKKERVELRLGTTDASVPASQLAWQYRLIIRTSELLTLRGSVLEDALQPTKPSNNSSTYNTKEVLDYVAPELQLNCLKLGVANGGAEEQLLRLDEQCITRHYKVGVMYCKSGQSTEEEMYNNQEAGPAFVEFLQMLGETVRLKDFDKYKAGLDNRTDSTGLYSVYRAYKGCEIMFHVSTMLPYTPNNRQQLLRKRHIGNDIVTIVFQEPGAAPFTPRNIRSQFQHVFVVVRAIDPCTDNTHYKISVSRAKEVPLFGPPIKHGGIYPKGEAFTDLLLSKIINGENAAIQSPKFSTMATRTRQEYLKDLAKNYVSGTTVESGQKFSIFSSLLMKGGSNSSSTLVPRLDITAYDVSVGGALCFHVHVQDEGAGGCLLDCTVGISADTAVFIEDLTRLIILVLPTQSLLGWVVTGEWTRIYYHKGESVRIRYAPDSLLRRLASVAPYQAHLLQEMTLQRGPTAQLGFHVKPDGLVTAVEGGGCAARAGIKPRARLLEVCRAAVVALHHDQLVDLLKHSEPVTVTVTFALGMDCQCDSSEEWTPVTRADAQHPVMRRQGSPPRSDSEGYGTGSSGRSARRSPQQPTTPDCVLRRRSHDDSASPRHSRLKRASHTSSLTEEMMRLIDAGLNENQRHSAIEGQRTLPLPDAAALDDWSALVQTATRAMLQICEETAYPSIETLEPTLDNTTPTDSVNNYMADVPVQDQNRVEPYSTSSPNNAEVSNCSCGLTARVAALENAAATSQRQRSQLEEEVRRLRRQNARLREDSARAAWELRHFTQWLRRAVDKQ